MTRCTTLLFATNLGVMTPRVITPGMTPILTPFHYTRYDTTLIPNITPGITPTLTPNSTPGMTPTLTLNSTPGITPTLTPNSTPEMTPGATLPGNQNFLM